ncbi:MAG: two component transcriptional regulator, AraC family [Pedosphaera sp.]|nr:two component transcriptional regulator, AraC family [Pedosphaera sp.]
MIRRLKPEVVTLDIRMPEMNGINVLEAIKREKVETMVIVLTGLAEMEYRQKCLELGAQHFFHKATEFEKVIEILTYQVSQPEVL